MVARGEVLHLSIREDQLRPAVRKADLFEPVGKVLLHLPIREMVELRPVRLGDVRGARARVKVDDAPVDSLRGGRRGQLTCAPRWQ